ncbi:SDR family NAD(P)-dependent oxidoreductase [Micromonospora echinofusca]|uniref:SDR family NAD(P)-dependent oxidoreductase n=1 Tax=Micromonospora echinofusca TaxID=47858 RepID=A0ABS3VK88_MICEH|nr:SDR family NAD(P)-dependent oxidoreductase [Micromonospora echinofusca]MBO4204891.1 SDR family NAD(P)-dependent oxidoreductase [Micromonospora echinofusca]
MSLSGRRILITGGTSGIGAELVSQLTDCGARVATCGRDPQRLATVTRRTGALGWAGDLADPTWCASLVHDTAEALGGLDIVIANAAVQHQQWFTDDWSAERAAAVVGEVQVNLVAPVVLAGAAVPHLRRSAGRFVAVSSALGYSPKKSAPVYCASKAGLGVFLKALRYQMQDDRSGVTVQEVVLPLVATPMTAGRNEGAMPAGVAAAQIVRGLRRRSPVVAVGRARQFRAIQRVAPGVADAILRNA